MNWPTCQIIIYHIFLVSPENPVELVGALGTLTGVRPAFPLLCLWRLKHLLGSASVRCAPRFSYFPHFGEFAMMYCDLQCWACLTNWGILELLKGDEFLQSKSVFLLPVGFCAFLVPRFAKWVNQMEFLKRNLSMLEPAETEHIQNDG